MRLRILVLPPDSIDPPISRCAYLARGLSRFADVYSVQWKDPRSAIWQGKHGGLFNDLCCIVLTLFRRTQIHSRSELSPVHGVSCSLILDTLLYRILGRVFTTKLKYWYNRRVLQRVIEFIKPDVVFHADNFYLAPPFAGQHISISDTQDGINWNSLHQNYRSYRRGVLYDFLKQMDRAYIVSDAAGQHLNATLPGTVPFVAIPNGAAFDEIRAVPQSRIEAFRKRHGLTGKFVVSYIGGTAKFDPRFARQLFDYASNALPDVQFLIVGNIPKLPCSNATWVGAVPPDEAAVYYNLSDAGMILRNCDNDPFLDHSVPLKLIQYAAARKPVVGFQVQWAREGRFPNLFEVRTPEPAEWDTTLTRVRKFRWTSAMDQIWLPYSWDVICQTIAEDLQSLVVKSRLYPAARCNDGPAVTARQQHMSQANT
jgi:hypothetical protein